MMLLHRFAGDMAELGIIRAGAFMTLQVVLNPRIHLVCYYLLPLQINKMKTYISLPG